VRPGEVVPGLVELEVAVPACTGREVGVGRSAKNTGFRQGTAVTQKYQKDKIDTPAGDGFVVPEQVSVAMAEIAGCMREGLLALAVGTGLQVRQVLMEADGSVLAGPKGKHDTGAARSATVTSAGRWLWAGAGCRSIALGSERSTAPGSWRCRPMNAMKTGASPRVSAKPSHEPEGGQR
jgi:hypothetical protein